MHMKNCNFDSLQFTIDRRIFCRRNASQYKSYALFSLMRYFLLISYVCELVNFMCAIVPLTVNESNAEAFKHRAHVHMLGFI